MNHPYPLQCGVAVPGRNQIHYTRGFVDYLISVGDARVSVDDELIRAVTAIRPPGCSSTIFVMPNIDDLPQNERSRIRGITKSVYRRGP
jgi:hypothetical protein